MCNIIHICDVHIIYIIYNNIKIQYKIIDILVFHWGQVTKIPAEEEQTYWQLLVYVKKAMVSQHPNPSVLAILFSD